MKRLLFLLLLPACGVELTLDTDSTSTLAQPLTSVGRFYFPNAGAPAVSPAYSGLWNGGVVVERHALETSKNGAAGSTRQFGETSASPNAKAMVQYVSAPLAAQTISGTVKGQLSAWEAPAEADMRVHLVVRVVSNDGNTERGVVYQSGTGTFSNELSSTGFRNHRLPHNAPGAVSSVNVQANDRLVVEIGARAYNTLTENCRFGLSLGNPAGSADMPEGETGSGTPWLEFSKAIVLAGGTGPVDTTPPVAVGNLAASAPTAGSLRLDWSSPGDAAAYDVRYSTAAITPSSWGSASQASGEPSPGSAGASQSFTVGGLSANTRYHFALKSRDAAGNESALSNVPSAVTSVSSGGGGVQVPRFDVFEAVLTSAKTYGNPFVDVTVNVTFTAPSGRKLNGLAFHDGGNTWRARVAPDEVGAWSYSTSSTDSGNSGLHAKSGGFTCTASSNRGFIRPDPSKKYWFSFSDGAPFFGMGDTAYFFTTGISDAQRISYLDRRDSQKFNFIRFFASGSSNELHSSVSAAEGWPWGGTPSAPQYDRLNPQYFRRLERILGELKARGMFAEVEVFSYYTPPFTNPSTWTTARQNLWARYVVSRLAADTTVFLWTVTNEYETYPQGTYRYDGASDDDWAKAMGALFHATDPQKHPTTVHNFSFEANHGIGGRFGNSADLDVISQQSWGAATWNGSYLDGDATGVERAIAADRSFNRPVINTENGYEWLAGFPTTYNQQVTGTDKSRRAAWRVFAAGGAAYAAGFAGTWPGKDDHLWKGQGPLYFNLNDSGLAGQLTHFYTFVTRTNFRSLSPAQSLVNAPNLALANTNSEYVVYAPAGGTVVLNLSAATKTFSVDWFNPRTGATTAQASVTGGSSRTFTAPASGDWALRLVATN